MSFFDDLQPTCTSTTWSCSHGTILFKDWFSRRTMLVQFTLIITVFVSLNVKVVHLVEVSDRTELFLVALRCFIAHCGKSILIWSEHGSNFIGADREMHSTVTFCIGVFLSLNYFRSMKRHLQCITSNMKLTFEEPTTVLTQVEACLNSHPLAPPLRRCRRAIHTWTLPHRKISHEFLLDPATSF